MISMSAKPGCQAREIELPRLSNRGTLMNLYYLVYIQNLKAADEKFHSTLSAFHAGISVSPGWANVPA